MTKLIIGSRHLLAIFVVALFGMSTLAATAFAQDATETPATTIVTHPAHVHKGTCTQLDPNPAYPLDNVGPRLTDDDKMPDPAHKRNVTRSEISEDHGREDQVRLHHFDVEPESDHCERRHQPERAPGSQGFGEAETRQQQRENKQTVWRVVARDGNTYGRDRERERGNHAGRRPEESTDDGVEHDG